MTTENRPQILICKDPENGGKVFVNANLIASYWEEAHIDKQNVANDKAYIWVKTAAGDRLLYEVFNDLAQSNNALNEIKKAICGYF